MPVSDTEVLQPGAQPQGAPSEWDLAFARLRERFPKVKDTILFCVHALQSGDPDLGDLKAQAQMHGLRITAASLNAARELLQPGSRPARRRAAPAAIAPSPVPAPPAARARRKQPSATDDAEIEALIRALVAKVQARSAARIAELEGALRTSLAILDDAMS